MDLKIPMYPQFDETVIVHPLFDDTVIEDGSWPLLTGEVRPIEAPALTPHWFTVNGLF